MVLGIVLKATLLDDFLVERCFQPVADRTACWVSPYEIARFLAPGALVLACIGMVYAQTLDWLEVLIGCELAWAVLRMVRQAERSTQSRGMNSARHHWLSSRLGGLVFAGLSIGTAEEPIDYIIWLPFVFAAYLAAVERPTPPPKRKRIGGRSGLYALLWPYVALSCGIEAFGMGKGERAHLQNSMAHVAR